MAGPTRMSQLSVHIYTLLGKRTTRGVLCLMSPVTKYIKWSVQSEYLTFKC